MCVSYIHIQSVCVALCDTFGCEIKSISSSPDSIYTETNSCRHPLSHAQFPLLLLLLKPWTRQWVSFYIWRVWLTGAVFTLQSSRPPPPGWLPWKLTPNTELAVSKFRSSTPADTLWIRINSNCSLWTFTSVELDVILWWNVYETSDPTRLQSVRLVYFTSYLLTENT